MTDPREARIAELEAENAGQKARIAELERKVEELTALVLTLKERAGPQLRQLQQAAVQ